MVLPPAEEDPASEDGFVPGYRNFLIFCDDSGLHGSRHYGFGSFWIPFERRGDLQQVVRDLRIHHRVTGGELKWNNITNRTRDLYCDLVRLFFARRWMMFHCLVVRRGYVDKEFHGGDYDLARRKHFAMLLQQKIGQFSKGAANKLYHVRVDVLPSAYQKADEVAFKIVNSELKHAVGIPALRTLFTRDSKATLGIQMADILLGSVMSDVDDLSTAPAKLAVRAEVARHLRWPDLTTDTFPKFAKFNIWRFWNPKGGEPREAQTRPVQLLVPAGDVQVQASAATSSAAAREGEGTRTRPLIGRRGR
jgi:hypothetical protein